MGTVKCYALKGAHGIHCPLSTDAEPLKRTFNYFVRGSAIVEIEIDDTFVCHADRMAMCDTCPFKH